MTALISISCICRSALSDRTSFWHALQYTYVLTALWQLASKEKTHKTNLNSEYQKKELCNITHNEQESFKLTKLGSLFKQASINSLSGLL